RECHDYVVMFTTEYGYAPPESLLVLLEFMQKTQCSYLKRLWLVQLAPGGARIIDEYPFWHKLAGSAEYGRIRRQDETNWFSDLLKVASNIVSHQSCSDSASFCPRSNRGNTEHAASSNKTFYRRLISNLRAWVQP
ncbi:hypothetical protein, partial [Azotobacter beijerinckii]|uniref:hypothetical protein n=1 Tax=Azotobacter beijerinckii TaxID=170623 RepID=UPI001C31CA02